MKLLSLLILVFAGCASQPDHGQLDRIETQVQTLLERTNYIQRQLDPFKLLDGKCTRETKEINLNLLKVPASEGGTTVTHSMFLTGDPEKFRALVENYCGHDWAVSSQGVSLGE